MFGECHVAAARAGHSSQILAGSVSGKRRVALYRAWVDDPLAASSVDIASRFWRVTSPQGFANASAAVRDVTAPRTPRMPLFDLHYNAAYFLSTTHTSEILFPASNSSIISIPSLLFSAQMLDIIGGNKTRAFLCYKYIRHD